MVAAAFGDPLSDSMSELARLIGDWAFLDAAIRTSRPAGPLAPIADESPRTRARYDTWLDPQLLFPEERPNAASGSRRRRPPPTPAAGPSATCTGGHPI